MINRVNKRPGEGMQYELPTPDETKAIIKHRIKRMFLLYFSSATFLICLGYVIGSAHTSYIVINAIQEIDKLLVCK